MSQTSKGQKSYGTGQGWYSDSRGSIEFFSAHNWLSHGPWRFNLRAWFAQTDSGRVLTLTLPWSWPAALSHSGASFWQCPHQGAKNSTSHICPPPPPPKHTMKMKGDPSRHVTSGERRIQKKKKCKQFTSTGRCSNINRSNQTICSSFSLLQSTVSYTKYIVLKVLEKHPRWVIFVLFPVQFFFFWTCSLFKRCQMNSRCWL